MKPRRNLFLGSFLVIFSMAQVAGAGTIYWDGVSGSWNILGNWSTASGATTPNPSVLPTNADDLIFNVTTADGAETITLDADQAAKSLTFDNTGTTVIQANSSGSTARTLTLGSGGITMNSGTGAGTLGGGSFGDTTLAIGAAQSWTNQSSNLLTVTGGLNISNALTIGGSGNTTITGGSTAIWTGNGGVAKTGAGTLNIAGNISSATSRWTIGNNYGGNFSMEQGALNLSGIAYITLGDGSTANAIYTQTGGVVNLTPSGDTTGNGVYINNSTIGTETSDFNVSGGSFTIAGNNARIWVGRGASTTTGNLSIGGGVGTATVTAPNIYIADVSGRTGNVNLNANGILETSSITKGAGTGNLNFNGGTLKVRTGTTAGSTLLGGLTTAVINSGGATVDTNGINVTISQAFTGSGRLTKTGSGILTMTGNSSYSGGTMVSQGTLVLDLSARTGTINPLGTYSVSPMATLALHNTMTSTDNTLVQNTSFSGSGTITKTGGGYLTLHTGSSVTGFSGTIDVQAGTLAFNNMSANANTGASTLNIGASATFDNRYNSALAVDKLTGAGTLNHSHNSPVSVSVGNSNGSSTFDGVIKNDAGTLSLTKAGTGTFTLTGTNSYGGTTTVNGGILEFKNAGGTTRTQSFAALTLAGADATLRSTWDTANSISTTFNSLTARSAGNTANIVLSGGTPGSTNTLTINGGTAGTMIDRGVFFNGSSYAAYGASGVIRAYGNVDDVNYVAVAGGGTLGTRAAADNVAISGAITAQNSTTINTLNLGANNLTFQSTASTLGVSGILSSGATNAQIANGTNASALQAATAGGEMVIRVDGASDKLTIAPVIQNNSSASALTKSGAGTLVLTAVNTYTGTTTVNGGTLRLELGGRSANAALNAFNVASGAILNLDNTNTTAGSYFPTNFVLSGAGTVTKTNVGSIDWQTNTDLTGFSGTIDVQQGALRLNNLATGKAYMPQATLNIGNTALFDLRYANGTGTNLTVTVDKLTGSGTLDHTHSQTGTYNITVGANGGSSQFDGVIQNTATGTSPLSLTKTGKGTLTLAGTNSSYTGVTTIEGGILNVAKLSDYSTAGSLGARTAAQETAANIGLRFMGGTLQYTGSTIQSTNRQIRIGTAGGTIDASGSTAAATVSFTHSGANTDLFDTAGARTLTLTGTNTGANTFAIGLTDENASTGKTSLTKNGTGKWVLTGNSSHTGVTSINAGTLVINGDNSAATGAVSVSNTDTRLAGTGTIGGNTTINDTAIHSPGNSPGVQKFAGGLTYADGSIFEWEIDRNLTQTRGTGYDGVNVAGTLTGLDGADGDSTFDAKFRIVITDADFSNTFWNTNKIWSDIFTEFNGTTAKSNWASIFGGGFQYFYNNGSTLTSIATPDAGTVGYFTLSGSSLTWTAIPEPTSALVGLLIGAGLMRRRRMAAHELPVKRVDHEGSGDRRSGCAR